MRWVFVGCSGQAPSLTSYGLTVARSKASPDHHIRAAQTHQSFIIVAYRDAASPDSKNSAEKYKAGDKFITRCVLEARQNRKHRPAFGCVAS